MLYIYLSWIPNPQSSIVSIIRFFFGIGFACGRLCIKRIANTNQMNYTDRHWTFYPSHYLSNIYQNENWHTHKQNTHTIHTKWYKTNQNHPKKQKKKNRNMKENSTIEFYITFSVKNNTIQCLCIICWIGYWDNHGFEFGIKKLCPFCLK